MLRIFHRGEWFHEISPSALAEAEFEDLLISNSEIIRENTIIVPFKKTVYSIDRSARADLAMISEDYRYWIVVEVEMSNHGLHSHVIPQIRTLREAEYTQECVAYFHSKRPDLDKGKLSDLLRGEPPEVLVIANKRNSEWEKELRRFGVHLMAIEIFRSELNQTIFVIDGKLPVVEQNFLSDLSIGILPRCMMLSSPAALSVEPGERFPIVIDEQVTYWERFDTATAVYLTPVGNPLIESGQKYRLYQSDNGMYVMSTFKSSRG